MPAIHLPGPDEAPLNQPELFPPPDAGVWTAERSCASSSERQAILVQIDAEIRWRSTQLHKLRRSARGRILDCCDYFDGRKFTLQELKRRHTELRGLLDCPDGFEAALYKATRREARRRKSAPLHLRLAAYLDPIGRAGGGAWKPCPSYKSLAKALGVCVESISQAFKRLEEDSECPLAFACAYSGAKRCRQKHVAMKSWLKYDGLPLHFEEEGRHRKLRPTFRKGVERIEPPPFVAARYANRPTGDSPGGKRPHRGVSAVYTAGNSRNCLSHSIRLSPAVKDNPRSVPAKQRFRPNKPKPRKAVMSRSLENAAWRAAREASRDGELFWDNAKPKIPLPTLKSLILEAFEQGFEWKKHVRPALIFGIKEAHAAACLAEAGIRNPGAFAATIFRDRLATMKPDPDHLAQVIAKRREEPAASNEPRRITWPGSTPVQSGATPLPCPDPADWKKQAGARAMDRLAAYIEEHKDAIAMLSQEAAQSALMEKYEEFTEEELKQDGA